VWNLPWGYEWEEGRWRLLGGRERGKFIPICHHHPFESFALHLLMVIDELSLLIQCQTRDRVKMSRKDKRKFRRPGGASKVKD
jgi:hypothetical protein